MENNSELNFLLQVRMNNLDGVKNLLSLNAKLINACDEYDCNALIYALKDKNVELAKFLIERGVNIVQIDKFNNSPRSLALALGDKELIALVDFTSEKIYQKNIALSRKRANNPFHAFDIDNFMCWEITTDYSPFSTLDACSIFDCEVRTFIGIGAIHIERMVHMNRGGAMAMSTSKAQLIGQSIFIDIITKEPDFKGDVIMLKNMWRKNLDNDPVVKKRTDELERLGIRHIIDYDMRAIIYALNNIINNT